MEEEEEGFYKFLPANTEGYGTVTAALRYGAAP